jgi:hypothetical protein
MSDLVNEELVQRDEPVNLRNLTYKKKKQYKESLYSSIQLKGKQIQNNSKNNKKKKKK